MKKFISLFLIPVFTLLFFLSTPTPVQAACSFTLDTPTPITAGSSLRLTITGLAGEPYSALITNDATGRETEFFDTIYLEPGSSTGTIILGVPRDTSVGYTVGVWHPPSSTLPFEECGLRIPFTVVTDVSSCEGLIGCLSAISVPGLKFTNHATFIGDLIGNILPIVLALGGFITVIIIVISGIQFITSSGNPEAAAAARSRLIFALVGFAIIILAFAITQIVNRIFIGESGVV